MREPMFYCPDLAASEGDVPLPAAEAYHALRSLRLRDGQPVRLFDGQGLVVEGVLRVVRSVGSRRKAQAVVQPRRRHRLRPPPSRLTLVVAACKGARLDWMVEKCTELGVGTLLLAAFERSVVRVSETRLQKLHRTAIEACKQCGRAWLPQVRAAGPVAAVVRDLRTDVLLLADPDARSARVHDALAQVGDTAHVAAVVGPEGGLTEGEISGLVECGAVRVCLGPHTLRVETAAVVLAATWSAIGFPAIP